MANYHLSSSNRPSARVALIVLALALATPAGAENNAQNIDKTTPEAKPEQSSAMEPGWLPALGSIIPGALVHGSGHFLGGDQDTGYKLLAMEGCGLLGMAAGILPIGLLGASHKVIGPAYASTLLGFGLFSISGLADLYGSISAGNPTGQPLRQQPWLELELGLAWVHDPQFDYNAFSRIKATTWLHGVRLAAGTWLALDDDNQRVRGAVSYRIMGPRGPWAPRAPDGSYLDFNTAVSWQRFQSAGFETMTIELSLAGRLDMARLGESLRGSFAQLSLGWGMQLFDYHATDSGLGQDMVDLLLMRFGYGIYLGRPGELWGELMFFYDHRHDDFAAGSSLGFAGEGVPGHLGLVTALYFSSDWGMAMEVQGGSAWIAALSLRYRYGSRP